MEVADSEVVTVVEEVAVCVTDAMRAATHVERGVTMRGTAIRAEDLAMGRGRDADHITEGIRFIQISALNCKIVRASISKPFQSHQFLTFITQNLK